MLSSLITVVAIFGFFMPTSTNGERREKVSVLCYGDTHTHCTQVNMGITTLLAMAILLLMVSDSMPTTSNFIPLMGARRAREFDFIHLTCRHLLSDDHHAHLRWHTAHVSHHLATQSGAIWHTRTAVCACGRVVHTFRSVAGRVGATVVA
jgi:hypothetical protein